ncbi:unnamed protein product [Haemonchus placei]|uniref:DUF3006 domain-containing protein n=1 Tax=Haemonchus placei TaxID=6290 RepID=A0A0N4WH34_HAEPC|nr:unnamed protein product [Haemonchus placei]
MEADLVLGGEGLIVNANDKPVWHKTVDVLELQFDEAEAESMLFPGNFALYATVLPKIQKVVFSSKASRRHGIRMQRLEEHKRNEG